MNIFQKKYGPSEVFWVEGKRRDEEKDFIPPPPPPPTVYMALHQENGADHGF